MTTEPGFLDGNAAAGDLESLFGADMTMASGRCQGCGLRMRLAEAHAYLGGPGTVLRCPGCEDVLLRMVPRATSGSTRADWTTSGFRWPRGERTPRGGTTSG
ncbi:DUF6510 family protein [Streptomyces albogriseolus]|uniref:DUF6510 family protein n=1 Tax=Streptomyces albogriseolus TaxID=1887 RepID=UPI003795C5B1